MVFLRPHLTSQMLPVLFSLFATFFSQITDTTLSLLSRALSFSIARTLSQLLDMGFQLSAAQVALDVSKNDVVIHHTHTHTHTLNQKTLFVSIILH